MLVSMKTILDDANKNYYGVMAMNSINIEMARGGIMAAGRGDVSVLKREPAFSDYHPVWPWSDEKSRSYGGNDSDCQRTGC